MGNFQTLKIELSLLFLDCGKPNSEEKNSELDKGFELLPQTLIF